MNKNIKRKVQIKKKFISDSVKYRKGSIEKKPWRQWNRTQKREEGIGTIKRKNQLPFA